MGLSALIEWILQKKVILLSENSEKQSFMLPNSKWLRNILEHGINHLEEMLSDKEWQSANGDKEWQRSKDESVEGFKKHLKISMNIFEQCTKTGEGELVRLTEEQLDYLYECFILATFADTDGLKYYPETVECTHQEWRDSLEYYWKLIEEFGYMEGCVSRSHMRCMKKQ